MENSGIENDNDLSSLFTNLKLKFDQVEIMINNEKSFLDYLNKINNIAINFEKNYHYKYLNSQNIDEKNEKKFLSLFSKKNRVNESLNSNIKNTIKNNDSNSNVFILNNILEDNSQFCYEIKLGHGAWDNVTAFKNNVNLKIGLLELNKENIKEISEFVTINNNKQLIFQENNSNSERVSLFAVENDNKVDKGFDEYKKSVYYDINIDKFKVPISKNLENKDEKYRLIQKNDIIGIVYNNKSFKDFIEIKIYINGQLYNSELIIKPEIDSENDESDCDDDFEIEKKRKNSKISRVLVPFIEVGDNKTIFIKDKSTKKKELRKKIIYNERIEYIDIYGTSPLNTLPEEIIELQNVTKAYFDILINVGSKIFKYKKNEINKYFKQLISFFKNFSFINRLVAENCLLNFLMSGIDMNTGNIMKFKDNVETLLNVINEIEKNDDSRKIKLLEKIISYIIEAIMENNTNFLDVYKLEENNQNEFEIFTKSKFVLCFLLFENYFNQGQQIVFNLLSRVSLFESENIIYNIFNAIIGSCFYFNPVNTEDYIQKFYSNNKFQKIKFLDSNFRKYSNDKIYNKILEDNQYMMKIIIKEIDINKKEKTTYLLKFIEGFCSSDDNVSIINFIILNLIRYYFNKSISIDKSKVDKIIYNNYISLFVANEKENTFYGKKDVTRIHSISLVISEEERKEALIFNLIVKCISNYYEVFSQKEKNANEILELLSNPTNNNTNIDLYKINHMIEFYQSIYFGNFYLHLYYFTNHLLKFLLICIKEKYLDVVPYNSILKNILFILDVLKIRSTFIEKENLIEKNEIGMFCANIDKTLKYVTTFLGEVIPRIRNNNFVPHDNFEEMISLHIKILIKVLRFDKNIIKDCFNSIQTNLVLTMKNLAELYDKDKHKILYTNINKLIEFLYGPDSDKDQQIQLATRNIFFKNIMDKELEEFRKKVNDDNLAKSNYIEHTMYYNIFIMIYKRTKIIRESLSKIFENNFLFQNNMFYQKEYLSKFTKIIKIFYNFLTDNNMNMIFDTSSSCFLKVNSFVCKTFKVLHDENTLKKIQNIYEENSKMFDDFFTSFFFLLSHLLIMKDQNGRDFYYQMAQNRKGFYFEDFKINFEKLFGYPECKTMIEFLDILLNKFRQLCDDKDVLNLEDVNDNSIELDKRDSCPICLDFTDENDVHINPCNHVIHKKCLEELIKKSNKNQCPLCKRNILGIKEDPSFTVESVNSSQSSLFEVNNDNPFRIRNNIFLFGSNSRNEGSQRSNESNQSSHIGLFSASNRGLFSNDNNNINLNSGGGLFGNNSLFGSNQNNRNNLFSGNSLFG